MRRGWIAVAALVVAGCTKPAPDASGCKTDNDCKGERVCQGGECVEPKPAAAAPTVAAQAEPAPVAPEPQRPRAQATAPAPPAATAAPTSTAAEDPDAFGRRVLACFHPTAGYTSGTLGPKHKDADGRTAQDGHVEFSGGITGHGYSLDYVLHTKSEAGDKLIRVTPGKDTAFTKPNPKCSLREWTRAN